MPTSTLGLRDRKREETRGRLEAAAVGLVLRDGLEHATVDAISAAADVSPRTFFNYYDTKEDAILGIRDIDITPELVSEHIARFDGDGVVASTVALLLGLIAPTIEGAALHEQRHEVLRLHPQLLGRHVAQMTRMLDPLNAAVIAILDRDAGHPTDPALAETFLSLCAGAVRATVKRWISDGASSPVDTLHPRATELVTTLLERLS